MTLRTFLLVVLPIWTVGSLPFGMLVGRCCRGPR